MDQLTVRRLRIFVASPGDVRKERACLPEIVERLNRGIGRSDGVHLDLWRWEVDAAPELGEPQALINPEVDEADIVVVILWRRIGSPTSSARSGTVEEVKRSAARWQATGRPLVQVYVCKRPIAVSDLESDDALEQLRDLRGFLRGFEKSALMSEFSETEEFATRVHDNLQSAVRSLLSAKEPPASLSPRAASEALERVDWTGERSFRATERAEAHRLRDEMREALAARGFSREAQDSFATSFAELFTNAVTHGLGTQGASGRTVRVLGSVNMTYASLCVFNPPGARVEFGAWLKRARERLLADPFAPGGRGLLLLQSLADELQAEDEDGMRAVFYRDRVALAVETNAGVTILRVQSGHKNPSLAERINRAIAQLKPERFVLDLAGRDVEASTSDPVARFAQDVSRTLHATSGAHSGTTTAIGPCLPLFANRNWLWRIVCPNEALRSLLPVEIVHPTLEGALAALERAAARGN